MTSTETPDGATRRPRTARPPPPCTRDQRPAGAADLSNLRQSGIYVAFVVIVALFAILTDGVSLSPGNITNIVLQYSYILVLAIGMVLVIIGGHIDLSVGSVVALTGAVSAVLVIQHGSPGGSASSPRWSSVSRSARGTASGSPTSAFRPSS